MSKYQAMLDRARRGPHYWAQLAWREFQTQIMPDCAETPETHKAMAKLMGITTQRYCAFLRHNNLTIGEMSELAAFQGKRIRITLEPMP